MVKLLVIADDFTGALDTGVQFSTFGIATFVTVVQEINFFGFDSVPYDTIAENIQVLVVDLESRHIPAADAASRVANIVKQALQCGIKYFYKKTDSTLRGNIGAELSALLEASGGNSLAFVPAYPKTGRTTEDGHQYVNGVPLHQTAFAKDPLNPINDSYIPAIIKMQSDCNVVVCKLLQPGCTVNDEQTIRSDNKTGSKEPFRKDCSINAAKPPFYEGETDASKKISDPAIIVYDAKTDQDLLQIGRLLKNTDNLYVTAGCAGFAAMLHDLLGLSPNVKETLTSENQPGANYSLVAANQLQAKDSLTTTDQPHTNDTLTADKLSYYDRTLVICGSLNEVSLEQVRYAENQGWCSITIPPDVLLYYNEREDHKNENHKKIMENETIEKILTALNRNDKLIIKTLNDSKELSTYIRQGEDLGLDKKEIHLRIAHSLGLLVKRILTQTDIRAVVAFGGDTALGIMGAMKWAGLMPRDEILPGVAASEVLDNRPMGRKYMTCKTGALYRNEKTQSMLMVTKAGGFGDKDVLLKIDNYLTEIR